MATRFSSFRYDSASWPFRGNCLAAGQWLVHSMPQSKGRTTRLVARKQRRFSQSRIQRAYKPRINSKLPGIIQIVRVLQRVAGITVRTFGKARRTALREE